LTGCGPVRLIDDPDSIDGLAERDGAPGKAGKGHGSIKGRWLAERKEKAKERAIPK